MATLTIRLPDDKHNRLKDLAAYKHTSLNKLFEELSTRVITEFDSEVRFKALVAQGNTQKGLDLLDQLDHHFAENQNLDKEN